jgi:hypothetical protein
MYGLLGSRFSRYYDRDIAQSITLTGQLLIKESIRYCEESGFRVIAGDTDSCFVCASEADTKAIVDGINAELIPQLLEESGCETNAIKMDSDKGYHHLLIQAKKKYAGRLSTHKGRPAPDDMEPEVKGLEFQRSDQIRYAQRMQMHFLHLLLDPEATPNAIEAELYRWANEFMEGEIPRKDIEITQGVSKNPNDYAHPTPAVRVALDMIEAGKEFYTGMKVPYIVVQSKKSGKKGGKTELKVVRAIHADDYDGEFDRGFYWIKKILPPVERLVRVRFPDARLDELESLVRDPSQFRFDFQVDGDVKVKQPKVRKPKPKVKVPKPKVKKPKVKTIRKYLRVKEEHKIDTIKGLAKLVKGSKPGNINIWLLIDLDMGAEVTISTSHRVDKECLRKIAETFPWVEIQSKSI